MTRPTLSDIRRVNQYDTDKSDEFLRNYERAFAPYRDMPVNLLEIGVHKGGSLLLWRDYFPRGRIFGIDLHPPAELPDPSGRIRLFRGDQGDAAQLESIARQAGPSGLHVIIDDASHLASLTATTFQALFYRHLRPGGFYAIEDWGTGYWESWPDGARPEYHAVPHFKNDGDRFTSHQAGMVGLIKQLVDECGLADILHPRFGVTGCRRAYIRTIHLSLGLAIIEKTSE